MLFSIKLNPYEQQGVSSVVGPRRRFRFDIEPDDRLPIQPYSILGPYCHATRPAPERGLFREEQQTPSAESQLAKGAVPIEDILGGSDT